jgi:hypothetical protein
VTLTAVKSHSLTDDKLREYRAEGFIVRRGVFSSNEIAALIQECERLADPSTGLVDPKNLRCRFMKHHETGESLFEVFDPIVDASLPFQRVASDPRIVDMVESIYGEPASLFKEKLIFKPAGALGYDLHQDIPRYWAGFPRSFLTVLMAIDLATEENGCTQVYSGYHHEFLSPSDRPDLYMLPPESVDVTRRTMLLLEPGDVAIFDGLTPHCSDPNRSNKTRRGFYISYNAFSEGGDQRTGHYAQFHERMRQRLAPDDPGSLFFR